MTNNDERKVIERFLDWLDQQKKLGDEGCGIADLEQFLDAYLRERRKDGER